MVISKNSSFFLLKELSTSNHTWFSVYIFFYDLLTSVLKIEYLTFLNITYIIVLYYFTLYSITIHVLDLSFTTKMS